MRRRRSVAGPIMLITIGVLFAVDYIWGRWSFWHETWPVVLIVFGLVRLVEHMVVDDSAYYQNVPPWDKNWKATPWQDKDWARRQAMGENPPPPPGTPGYQASPAAPPPPPATDYPSYPVYPPSSSSSGSGEGHASS